MVDASAMSAMIGSLKAAAELAKLAVDARDAAVVRAKVIELQREIFAAQSNALTTQQEQFALLDRVRGLEKEVADLKAWDAETEKYQLTNVRHGPATLPLGEEGAFAYRLKNSGPSGEPIHFLCAQCFQDRKKSILQGQKLFPGNCDVLVCQRCSNTIYVIGHPYPEHFGLKPKRSGR